MKELYMIELLSDHGSFIGRALVCPSSCECPYFTVGSPLASRDACDAFIEGATYGGDSINLNYINMPIEINSLYMPYDEVRNTIVNEMKLRGYDKKYGAGAVKEENTEEETQ